MALNERYDKFMLVLNTGGPVDLTPVKDVGNILVMSQLGSEMGNALADVLLGKTNPSGKLAQAIPLDVGQIPLSYREKRTFIACGYADIPAKPLFPFGFGLSYATFAYARPTVEKAVCRVDEPVVVSVDVTNTGKIAGREIVQLYLRDETASVLPRERELREFTSVWLEPGETKSVSFTLPPEAFALYDADLKRVVEPGDFTVFVGGDATTQNAARLTLK